MSEYKIIKGNCFEILKNFPDHCIDLIATDPPYQIDTQGGGCWNKLKKFEKLKDLELNKFVNQYDILTFCEESLRIMQDINIYIWCNKKQIYKYLQFYVGKHNCLFDILFWSKTNPLPTCSNKYLTDCEYLLYFRKGKGKCFPQKYEDAKTYYISPINSTDKKKYGHPTVKPLDFTRRIIRNSSKEGQTVLDPFMGSGTSIVAALRENRKAIGIEINEEYFNIAKKRIENETLDLKSLKGLST